MKNLTYSIVLISLLLIAGEWLIGCGRSGQTDAGSRSQSFSLRTNFDEFLDDEIDSILFDEILSSFTPDVWDFIVLAPEIPIQDSTFIQVGAPTENVGYQFTVEIGFETKEKGLTLYRLYTTDKALVLEYLIDYWKDQVVPDVHAWEDVTWEMG